jgi:hypothetical protein
MASGFGFGEAPAQASPRPDPSDGKPAREFIAPPGHCEFCDRRRAQKTAAMKRHRENAMSRKPPAS